MRGSLPASGTACRGPAWRPGGRSSASEADLGRSRRLRPPELVEGEQLRAPEEPCRPDLEPGLLLEGERRPRRGGLPRPVLGLPRQEGRRQRPERRPRSSRAPGTSGMRPSSRPSSTRGSTRASSTESRGRPCRPPASTSRSSDATIGDVINYIHSFRRPAPAVPATVASTNSKQREGDSFMSQRPAASRLPTQGPGAGPGHRARGPRRLRLHPRRVALFRRLRARGPDRGHQAQPAVVPRERLLADLRPDAPRPRQRDALRLASRRRHGPLLLPDPAPLRREALEREARDVDPRTSGSSSSSAPSSPFSPG